MRRKIILPLGLLLMAVLITLSSALRSESQSELGTKQQMATPVQEGVISERQKEHSKLYRGYNGAGRKLRDLAEEEIKKGKSDDIGIVALPGIPELDPNPTPFRNVLTELACGADAIVIGIVKDKSSQLTESGTFIFTDYEFTVENLLKDNTRAHIELGTSLTATRPGGKILLNGHVITAVDRSAKPLELGRRYILFLHFLPTTGAYQAASSDSAFQIDGAKLINLTDAVTLAAELKNAKDAPLFVSDIRNTVALCH